MRDLKHLQFFEDLLQVANNPLISQAKEEGLVCVAYTCENVPEPLVNLPGCFSVRLHAPNTGSMDIATYYMTNRLCEPSRALLERAVEGGFNFADCVITPDGCTMMNRAVENMELLNTMGKDKPNFFHEYMEIAGIVGLFKIWATPLVAFQSAFTCAAGMVGLFKIWATPLVAFQSAFTCAAGIAGLSDRSL